MSCSRKKINRPDSARNISQAEQQRHIAGERVRTAGDVNCARVRPLGYQLQQLRRAALARRIEEDQIDPTVRLEPRQLALDRSRIRGVYADKIGVFETVLSSVFLGVIDSCLNDLDADQPCFWRTDRHPDRPDAAEKIEHPLPLPYIRKLSGDLIQIFSHLAVDLPERRGRKRKLASANSVGQLFFPGDVNVFLSQDYICNAINTLEWFIRKNK